MAFGLVRSCLQTVSFVRIGAWVTTSWASFRMRFWGMLQIWNLCTCRDSRSCAGNHRFIHCYTKCFQLCGIFLHTLSMVCIGTWVTTIWSSFRMSSWQNLPLWQHCTYRDSVSCASNQQSTHCNMHVYIHLVGPYLHTLPIDCTGTYSITVWASFRMTF